MTTAKDITETLLSMSDEKQREVLCRFFKTGKGEYGEGDRFIGLRVPHNAAIRYRKDGRQGTKNVDGKVGDCCFKNAIEYRRI